MCASSVVAADWVRLGLVATWAAAAAATLRRPELRPLGLRLASGTVLGSIGFASARYADGTEELYDQAADPAEWNNLGADPQHAAVKAELRQVLTD